MCWRDGQLHFGSLALGRVGYLSYLWIVALEGVPEDGCRNLDCGQSTETRGMRWRWIEDLGEGVLIDVVL